MKHTLFGSLLSRIKQAFTTGPVLMYALMPWSEYWGQGMPELKDGQKVKLHVGTKDCKKGKNFRAEVALSPAARSKGLSGKQRKPLKGSESMLFAFEKPEVIQMWMKETYIPLTVGFFDSDGKMIQEHTMKVEENPEEPEQIYSSNQEATASLEVAPQKFKVPKGGHLFLCIDPPKKEAPKKEPVKEAAKESTKKKPKAKASP